MFRPTWVTEPPALPRPGPAAVPVGLALARSLNGLITCLRDPLNTRALSRHTREKRQPLLGQQWHFHFSLALAYASPSVTPSVKAQLAEKSS